MPIMPNVGFKRKEVTKQGRKWELVRDCLEGQEQIKSKRTAYLPMPETSSDPETNKAKYEKYICRAVFFPVTSRTVEGLVGQVFSKDIAFDVPSNLEFLQMDVDGSGMTLQQHAKATLEDTVALGRGGLLVDAPTTQDGEIVTQADIDAGRFRPRIIYYRPESIINWRETTIGGETKLSLLVLAEDKIEDDDGFEFKCEPRWRVYRYNEETRSITVQVWKLKSKTQATDADDYEPETDELPILDKKGQPMDFIPFVFCGAMNNDSSVDESPLYPLAVLNIAHFRNSADYEQSTFLVGNPTPVFTGLTNDWMDKHFKNKKITLGSATAVGLPQGATAMLLQPEPNSQPMEAMKHKEEQMKAVGAKLIEPGTVERTATEAEIEETSDASILSTAAKNVSAVYEKAVYYCSFFLDAGEVSVEDITVQLNSEFQVMGLAANERQEVVAAWQGGLLAWEEVRAVYRKKGIAFLPDDEARTKIDEELAQSGFGDESDPNAGGEDDPDDPNAGGEGDDE